MPVEAMEHEMARADSNSEPQGRVGVGNGTSGGRQWEEDNERERGPWDVWSILEWGDL